MSTYPVPSSKERQGGAGCHGHELRVHRRVQRLVKRVLLVLIFIMDREHLRHGVITRRATTCLIIHAHVDARVDVNAAVDAVHVCAVNGVDVVVVGTVVHSAVRNYGARPRGLVLGLFVQHRLRALDLHYHGVSTVSVRKIFLL